MKIATVQLHALTHRVNNLLGTSHSVTYISQVRNGKAGSAALQKITHDEIARMLQEAADQARRRT